MTERPFNPYEPPEMRAKGGQPAATRFRWRIIPAALLIFLGGIGFLIGLFFIVVGIAGLVSERDWQGVGFASIAASCYLLWGGFWLTAGYYCLKRRWLLTAAAFLIGPLLAILIAAVAMRFLVV